MKILLVSTGSGSRGGGEIFLDYLGQGLSDRGHEVLLWIPAHPRMDELAARCSRFAQVIRSEYHNTYDRLARSLSTFWNAGVSRRVAREWAKQGPDVIHLNKQNLEDSLDLVRALRYGNTPSVCTIHLTQTAHYLKAKIPGIRDWVSRTALGKYRGIIVAVEEARRNELRDFLGGTARTRTVFNGVPIPDDSLVSESREAKRAELGLSEGDLLVIGLGRLVKQKQPFEFLKTARELHRHSPSTRFLWIGEGELLSAWNAWIGREGLDSVISCAGWQSNTLPFLAAADLLLHVAEFEGLPFAVLESMAAGVPCAVARSFASEISLFDDETVLFLDDPSSLAQSLQNRETLRRITSKARELVRTRLSLDSMVESYEQIYQEVAGP